MIADGGSRPCSSRSWRRHDRDAVTTGDPTGQVAAAAIQRGEIPKSVPLGRSVATQEPRRVRPPPIPIGIDQ